MVTILKRIVLSAGVAIFGAVIGLLVALGVHEFVWPPWTVANLPDSPGEIDTTIVLFEMEFDDVSQDVLYQVTNAGEVYALKGGDWSDIGEAPNGEEVTGLHTVDEGARLYVVALTDNGNEFVLVNGQWAQEQSIAELEPKRTPMDCAWPEMPVRRETVTASYGLQLDRPLAKEQRCYVVFSDGSMQLYSRVTNAFELMNTLTIGAVLGAAFGFAATFAMMAMKAKRVVGERAT